MGTLNSIELNYSGRVENGLLKIVNRKNFDADLKMFEGKEVSITVKKKRKIRSSPINRYYWGVMVKMIMDGLKEQGMKVKLEDHDIWMAEIIESLNKEIVHDFLKNRFIESIVVDTDTGEIIENERSTRKMTNTQFIEYYTPIYDWAKEFLGINIPYPNEQFETNVPQLRP